VSYPFRFAMEELSPILEFDMREYIGVKSENGIETWVRSALKASRGN
jgi:hypothetical protein